MAFAARAARRKFAPGPRPKKAKTAAGAGADAESSEEDGLGDGGAEASALDEPADELWEELGDLGVATLCPLLDPLPVPEGTIEDTAAAAVAADVADLVAEQPVAGPAPSPSGLRAPRGAAAQVISAHVPGGRISWYASKNAFEAVCSNRRHGKCVMTRTAAGSAGSSTTPSVGGRPCGFLAAWLANSEHTVTKASHWGIDCQLSPLDVRAAARERLKALPNGTELLSMERPTSAGEPEETPDDYIYMRLG